MLWMLNPLSLFFFLKALKPLSFFFKGEQTFLSLTYWYVSACEILLPSSKAFHLYASNCCLSLQFIYLFFLLYIFPYSHWWHKWKTRCIVKKKSFCECLYAAFFFFFLLVLSNCWADRRELKTSCVQHILLLQ